MAVLTRDSILARNDLGRAEVDCPEWGGTVTVRGLTYAERNSLAGCEDAQAAVRAVTLCVIDPKSGAPLFEPQDAEELAKKNPAVIDRLARKILALSGINVAGAEAEKN